MIPLIQARRRFNPPAAIPFEVTLLAQAHQTTSASSHTISSIALGDASSTRQFWLCFALRGSASFSATLGGNSFTLAFSGANGSLLNGYYALDGYTDDTIADLITSYGASSFISVFLLRVETPLSLTAHDSQHVPSGSGGTWNHNMSVPANGLLMGSGIRFAASAPSASISGLDNMVYNNAAASNGRHAVGWHARGDAETAAVSFSAGGSISSSTNHTFASFGPAV